jgi:hypothetical protein
VQRDIRDSDLVVRIRHSALSSSHIWTTFKEGSRNSHGNRRWFELVAPTTVIENCEGVGALWIGTIDKGLCGRTEEQ